MMRQFLFFVMLTLTAVSPSACLADLTKALAEPDLEKRSGLALDNAAAVFKTTRAAYQEGDGAKLNSGIAEIQESVELAATSLAKTGKNPRKSPEWFERAEIATRDLLRRLDSFQNEMAFDDRPRLDPLKKSVQKVHEDLLVGLMEGKRK